MSVEVPIKMVNVGGKVSFTETTSETVKNIFTEKTEKSTTFQYGPHEYTISPCQIQSVTAILRETVIDVPYTATIRFNNGKVIQVFGKYHDVHYSDNHIAYSPY